MFSAMTLGIGVDFAIHLTERFRHLAAADPLGRMRDALRVTGPAIAVNALVVAAGYAVMVFSEVPANGRLGLFVVTGVGT
jgi:predicted RND superfamily exporter protein